MTKEFFERRLKMVETQIDLARDGFEEKVEHYLSIITTTANKEGVAMAITQLHEVLDAFGELIANALEYKKMLENLEVKKNDNH